MDRQEMLNSLKQVCGYVGEGAKLIAGSEHEEIMLSWIRALELAIYELQAKEPRVLTMEVAQAIKAPGTLMWLETSGGYDGCRYKAIPVIISGNTHGILPENAMHFYNTADRAWSAYNREICGWRLWTNEPSDEVRVMTSWN